MTYGMTYNDAGMPVLVWVRLILSESTSVVYSYVYFREFLRSR